MKFIRPIIITDAILTSSTAPETDYAAWNVGTAYTVGQRVIRVSTHRCYECLVAHTGATPETNLTGTTPKWLDIGPTNRWAPFDDKVGTQTVLASPLTIVLQPGQQCNALALLQIFGTSLTVSMTSVSGGGTVYNKTLSLLSKDLVTDWFQYFYSPINRVGDIVLTDLPMFYDGILTITITDPSLPVKLGVCVIGLSSDIGEAQYGVKAGIIDYSKRDTDAFGNTYINKRKFSKRMSLTLWLPASQVDPVFNLLTDYRATPVVWIGADNRYQALIQYGFYKDFEVDIAYPTFSLCTLTIEGLT